MKRAFNTGSFGATIVVETFRDSLLMNVDGEVKCLLMILAANAIHLNHLCYQTEQQTNE